MKLLIASTLTALALGTVWLVSCATKPAPLLECPDVTAIEAFSPQLGHGYWLSGENLEKLRQTLKGLNDGSCKLAAARAKAVRM